MRKSAIVGVAIAAFGLCGPVFAEEAKTGPVAMTDVELDQVVAGVGNGSDTSQTIQGIYGNTTNDRASGHGVTPSLSPGPWACANPADCFDGAVAGGSVGEFINLLDPHGNASPDFANGTNTVKDNFGAPYDHAGVGS